MRVPDLKPFAPLSGAPLRGDADLGAHVDYSPSLTQLTADLKSHLDGGAAAWAGLVRGGLTRLQVAAEMTDQQFSVQDLQLTARAISLSAAARAAQDRRSTDQCAIQPGAARPAPRICGPGWAT